MSDSLSAMFIRNSMYCVPCGVEPTDGNPRSLTESRSNRHSYQDVTDFIFHILPASHNLESMERYIRFLNLKLAIIRIVHLLVQQLYSGIQRERKIDAGF